MSVSALLRVSTRMSIEACRRPSSTTIRCNPICTRVPRICCRSRPILRFTIGPRVSIRLDSSSALSSASVAPVAARIAGSCASRSTPGRTTSELPSVDIRNGSLPTAHATTSLSRMFSLVNSSCVFATLSRRSESAVICARLDLVIAWNTPVISEVTYSGKSSDFLISAIVAPAARVAANSCASESTCFRGTCESTAARSAAMRPTETSPCATSLRSRGDASPHPGLSSSKARAVLRTASSTAGSAGAPVTPARST